MVKTATLVGQSEQADLEKEKEHEKPRREEKRLDRAMKQQRDSWLELAINGGIYPAGRVGKFH